MAEETFEWRQLVYPELARGLQELGIYAPNSIQSRAIPLGLSGRDVLVCAQTGSGKTLTFLLPILNRLLEKSKVGKGAKDSKGAKGVGKVGKKGKDHRLNESLNETSGAVFAVVLAPTDQLAQQVADVAKRILSSSKKRQPFDAIQIGHKGLGLSLGIKGTRLIIGTPEIIAENVKMFGEVQMLAIDEADLLLCEDNAASGLPTRSFDLTNRRCLAKDLLEDMRFAQLFLTMAHLTEQREKELLERFPKIQQVGHIGVLVPTLRQCFHYFKGDETAKRGKLLWILGEAEKEEPETAGATMIFCASPAKAIELQRFFADEKPLWKTLILHDESTDISEIAQRFRDGFADILIANDMAVRGLDFPLLRHVILYDVPSDATAFVHCAGRTARSGNAGLVTAIIEAGNAGENHFDGKAIHALKDGPQLQFAYKNQNISLYIDFAITHK